MTHRILTSSAQKEFAVARRAATTSAKVSRQSVANSQLLPVTPKGEL